MSEYIKKEDVLFKKWQFKFKDVDGEHWFVNIKDIESLPTYSFPESKEMKQLYSDLLRVKHGTMNIDSLIDKVYADMRGKSCNTCKNSNDDFSGECYECVKNIQNHYEPQESEEDFPQAKDIEPTVKGFADTMDIIDRICEKEGE